MIGRVFITAIILLAMFIWILVDPSDHTTKRQQPIVPKIKLVQPIKASEKPMKMMEITLPPPPKPKEEAPAIEALTPSNQRVDPSPRQKIAYLKTSQKPVTRSRPSRPAKTTLQIEPVKPVPQSMIKKLNPMPKNTPLKQPKKTNLPPAKAAASPVSKQSTGEGRSLLKLLEHGKGPSVEIEWPTSATLRRRLYNIFKQCYGMRIALMHMNGRLFDETSRPGQAWSVNLDRYSGFMRQSTVGTVLDEYRTIRRIRARHGLGKATAVRLFPRETDAMLLGGLRNLIGKDYNHVKRIQARYQISGTIVSIANITIDAKPVAGRIELSSGAIKHCAI